MRQSEDRKRTDLRRLVLAALVAATACTGDAPEAQGQAEEAEEAAVPAAQGEDTAAAYTSAVCPRIDADLYASVLGEAVPPLTVTSDGERFFRCESRTEDVRVALQFRADESHYARIPDSYEALGHGPLDAYRGDRAFTNLLIVRLESPWSVVVSAATQSSVPELTRGQATAILSNLASLR
ncbi:MAG: hypothetical protein PVF05_04535 [Gemmatimonadales bacterium]|jgi:hypothetical protein